MIACPHTILVEKHYMLKHCVHCVHRMMCFIVLQAGIRSTIDVSSL